MSYREVVVLYPSHGLEDFPTDLPDEKAAGLLNAFAVAWHPTILAATKLLPREQRADEPPTTVAERLILVPSASDELVPTGWIDQARADGATVVVNAHDRDALVKALLEPLGSTTVPDAEIVADFFALGTCRLMVELLSRRMHHFGSMDESGLLRETIAAAEAAVAGDLDAARTHLKNAFEVLTETRERFYPVECYLLDLCLVIPRLADAHLTTALAGSKPLNLLATGADLEAMLRARPELGEQLRQALEAGTLDILGGEYHERPIPLLPLASVLREFERGYAAFQNGLGRTPTTWARRRYGFSTLIPQILHRFGYQSALHVALDDGIYPDTEQSRIQWEGCDGTALDATSRIPLAADSAASFLRFASRMAESMQQDQTAAVLLARWPEVGSPFWRDFERIHSYSPVLGRFATFRQFFEQTDDSGRHSRFEESEYLSPFLIQAVAAEEVDAIGRFRKHFEGRARLDAGLFLDRLASILIEKPLSVETGADLEERLESSGPDLPALDASAPAVSDAEIEDFVQASARKLGAIILHGSAGEPGYLVLNPLSFDRTVTVELPKLEVPPATQAPVRGVQIDAGHRHVTVDLPACGYVWISTRGPKPTSPRGTSPKMAEGVMVHNEFIEVHINEATGGIGKIKKFGRQPNRLSQQLAFRFPRERTISAGEGEDQESERTYYSVMCCASIAITASGPALGEIVSTGVLIDPEDRSRLAEFRQTVRVWRGRPVIELEIELKPLRMPEGDPWSNYFASRFAWNDSAATLTRSVLGGAHTIQWERFESPHFLEIATESQRTTLLNRGLTFHRKTGMRMVDSLLVVAGESSRHFRFGIAIDNEYPMQPAMDALVPPVVLETSSGPPSAGRSGWLFHVDAKSVQITQILPLKPPVADGGSSDWETAPSAPSKDAFGFTLRLVETEGRHRPVQIRCFRSPSHARQCDFRGQTISTLRIVDDAVFLEMTAYEIVDVELRFGDTGSTHR